MEIFNNILDWQAYQKSLAGDIKLGLVPTMGHLHAGHQSLLARARSGNDKVILSILINPTQFNNPEDFQQYPRTLTKDLQIAQQCGVDGVFSPEPATLYPDDYCYRITETVLSQAMEGRFRPGHFDGMLTIVFKLLQLIKPRHVYFGEKDYQQLQLVQGLINAFFLDSELITCPTIRDPQGLALSSRNSRLTPEQYELAHTFPKLLQSDQTCEVITQQLMQVGFHVDYIEESQGRRYGAVQLGAVRLIDNIKLKS